MFKRLAKSKLADFKLGGFRPLQPRRVALRGAGFFIDTHSNDTHSNDNLPGFRRPKGPRRIPSPALACHWIDRNGRLECRWQTETNGDTPIGDINYHKHYTPGRASGLLPMQPRGLALAG